MKKWIIITAIVITIIIIITAIVIISGNVYRMNGNSMEPTYYNGDIVKADKSITQFFRGDVIVFKRNINQESSIFIKRIVGMPNEKISTKDGKFYVNDKILDLSVIVPTLTNIRGEIEITLASDEYFVIGDNLNRSLDSRVLGPIKKSEIIGKVIKNLK